MLRHADMLANCGTILCIAWQGKSFAERSKASFFYSSDFPICYHIKQAVANLTGSFAKIGVIASQNPLNPYYLILFSLGDFQKFLIAAQLWTSNLLKSSKDYMVIFG